ncbi:MAG: hypothetical protein ACFBSE_16315 [Prochloraceae cyanobacterium]
MKNSVVKLLTVASLGLLINAGTTPANAAAAEKTLDGTTEETRKQLPPHIKQWAVFGAAGLAGIAVLIGTGHSMKHEKDAMKQTRANKGIKTPSVRS